MNSSKYFAGVCIPAAIVLFAIWTSSEKRTPPPAQQVNLAFRQAAHKLYIKMGDSLSLIPAVVQNGQYDFSLEFSCSLNYGDLPWLLDEAFAAYQIENPYEVLVRDCEDEVIVLGYNRQAFQSGVIPCLNREKSSECNVLTLSFADLIEAPPKSLLGGSVLLFCLGLAMLAARNSPTEVPLQTQEKNTDFIPLGKSQFNPETFVVKINGNEKKLTYQESKLLECFAKSPNTILERKEIQDYVWKDEGVIVSRSLDVFISRLRKILSPDDSLKIVNIRGVGYRLEVR